MQCMTKAMMAALGMSLFLFSPVSLADIPPPPGYVEQCTMAKAPGKNDDCLECPAYYGQATRCEALGDFAYTSKCRSSGASVWREIWCRKKGTGTALPKDLLAALPNSSLPLRAGGATVDAAAAPSPSGVSSTDPMGKTPPKGGCASCSVGATPQAGLSSLAAGAALVLATLRRRRRS
ncbi:MAG: MYXO-CTERM sorting domain-containing protein [Myxococcales bacterium]